MARPPQANPPRPRATGQSYPKHPVQHTVHNTTDLPTPVHDEPSPSSPTNYLQPVPTPPYSSTEDFGVSHTLSHPDRAGSLMAPPSMSPRQSVAHTQTHDSSPVRPLSSSISPQRPMPGGCYLVYPYSYPTASYFPESYSYSGIDQYLVQENGMRTPVTEYQPGGPNADCGAYVNSNSQPSLNGPSDVDDASKPGSAIHTPRPPNAWILYRSDKLKAIAAGDEIPGLDSVMAELGVSGSSSFDEREKKGSDKDEDDGSAKTQAKTKKKGKKGGKEPTEALLSLGSGKTGRGLPQADISKMISILWKRESEAVRAEYERRSEMKKAEHAAMYPGYKFKPLRKADKLKLREQKERDKEAARREKELQRSGGRRRPRTRARVSPTTPYSVLTPEGSRATARTLTYTGNSSAAEAAHESLGASVSGNQSGYNSTPGDTFDEHRFRSYPFPMPQASLPSLRPKELGIPEDESATTAEATRSTKPATTTSYAGYSHADATAASGPLSHAGRAHGSPPLGQNSVSHHTVNQGSVAASTAPHISKSAAGQSSVPAPPPHVRPAVDLSKIRTPSSYSLREAYGQMADKLVDQIDAHDLVSLWCAKEDDASAFASETSTTRLGEPASITSAAGKDQSVATEAKVIQDAHLQSSDSAQEDNQAEGWVETHDQQHTFAEVELRSIPPPMYPGGWIQVPAPSYQVRASPYDPQTHFIAPEDALVVDGNAYAYAPTVGLDGSVELPVFYASDMSMMPNATMSWNEDFYLQFPDGGEETFIFGADPNGPFVPMEAIIMEEPGPFLSEQTVFTPGEGDWALRPTQPNVVLADQNPADDRNPALSSLNHIPRHVSSSSFPLTPHSATGSLPGSTAWTDRSASFSFANALQGPLDMGTGEDLISWEDEESATQASSTRPRSRISSRSSVDTSVKSCGKGNRSTTSRFSEDHTVVE